MASLANNISSTTIPIKNKADVIIDLLIDTIENQYMIQPLVHLCLYGNARAKSMLLGHLNGKNIMRYCCGSIQSKTNNHHKTGCAPSSQANG
jgi:hypothetical protein